jgi:GMP synthase (glutamine-hydrolysing)
VDVEIVEARKEFFAGLKGITNPEEKREAITQTFYRNVFGRLVKESGAKHLLQGTILTDVEETAAGIKRQHNVFEQIGIDPKKAFGYRIIEPLVQLRKDGVRKSAWVSGSRNLSSTGSPSPDRPLPPGSSVRQPRGESNSSARRPLSWRRS